MPDEIAGHQEAAAPTEVIAASGSAGPDAVAAGGNPVDPGVEVERFAVASAFTPSSADDNNRTIDAVWYTGVKVPRLDWRTGEEYDLILSMKGCRLDRLNNGGPVLDSHMASKARWVLFGAHGLRTRPARQRSSSASATR